MKHINKFKIGIMVIALASLGTSFFGSTAQAQTTTNANTTTNTNNTTDTNNTNTNTNSSSTVNIMVMKHLCNADIKNLQDFEKLEVGKSPIAALANTVLNCPTTGLPSNTAVTGTVASPRMNYNFGVKGENYSVQTLANANFMQHKICESDINVDVNADGNVSSMTCLDISHYEFPMVQTSSGKVDITESASPAGFHFGALRFTPTSLAANNDRDSLKSIDSANGIIHLDTTGDTDKMIMLHVYNFHNATTGTDTDSGNGTSITPPNFNGIGNIGWLVLTQASYNLIFGNANSGSTDYTMVKGYPKMGNDYVDCNGNIDNDMDHHTSNGGDPDPAHHRGQNCPDGSPKPFVNMNMGNNFSSGMTGNLFTLFGNGENYVVVPLNGDWLQKLYAHATMMH